jgi:gamma-glutamyl:cysteine ligase YbdK (ATP-grasp superfamily)
MTTTAARLNEPTLNESTLNESTLNESTLDEAVRAVTAALAALNTNPAGTDVENAIERAEGLLDGLEPGLSAIVLSRLLASIRDCHREGRQTSVQLRARRASAARALHLDPRRHPPPTRQAS